MQNLSVLFSGFEFLAHGSTQLKKRRILFRLFFANVFEIVALMSLPLWLPDVWLQRERNLLDY
ncbi:MAG: hypothetical protein COA42_13830 [Alteromonadaceae bacterium]|nr:MAG: hypothetical protein COA42_13830 [Alteromonadaceae bacterium]